MISSTVFSQKIEGAWEFKSAKKDIVLLYKDGYFTRTEFTPTEFLLSWGGVATTDAGKLKISLEFNSANSENVGKEVAYNFLIDNGKLQINEDGISTKYKRIDDGNAALAGVWKISGREQDGKIVAIHQTGNRFQWFAINSETKQFSGTGGGTYSFSDGKYTENIQFFSRDNNRVGAQLAFDGKIQNSEWHHSGLSSKGDKIYEVWSRKK